MREIKFRGKRKDNGEWVFGYVTIVDDEAFIQEQNPMRYPPDDEVVIETVGQFTGLKDKNGVELYEGDVLKSVTYRYVGEVKYVPENAAFLVFWSDDKGRHTDYLDDGRCSLIEVIGTMHDKEEAHDERD